MKKNKTGKGIEREMILKLKILVSLIIKLIIMVGLFIIQVQILMF